MDFLDDLFEGSGNRKRRGHGHHDDQHRDYDGDDRYDERDAGRSTIFCVHYGGRLQKDFK